MGKNFSRHFIKENIWMANKYMKSFSTPLAILEIQIKITMICHFTLTTMAIIFKFSDTKKSDGKYAKQLELSYITGENAKWYGHSENSLAVFYKVKHTLVIWPSNPTPRYLP